MFFGCGTFAVDFAIVHNRSSRLKRLQTLSQLCLNVIATLKRAVFLLFERNGQASFDIFFDFFAQVVKNAKSFGAALPTGARLSINRVHIVVATFCNHHTFI